MTSSARAVERDEAARWLSPPLLALFDRLKRSEQLHSLRVLHEAMAACPDSTKRSDLAVAALLHDVGKTRYPIVLWQRSLPVIVRRIAPGLLTRWSARNPRRAGWRPFAVYVHHPAWSADLMHEAGASERAIWLARHHADDTQYDHPDGAMLACLRRADDLN